jgi:hypothetical protein
MGKTRDAYILWGERGLENDHLKDHEEDVRITLRGISGI